MTKRNRESGRTVLRGALRRCALVFLVAGLLAGCATTGDSPGDPLEPINRAVFGFNEGFDRVLGKPVAEGYRAVLPKIVRSGVTNFFANIEDIWIAANNLLQGKVEQGLGDVMRVVINSSFGLFGVIDVATDAGLEKHNEDFGQTLGRWGFNTGPYIVLPFFGPSSVRDGIGTAVDFKIDPVVDIGHVPTRNVTYAVRATNQRADLLDTTKLLEEAALDKYTFTRNSYFQRRRNLVYDGDPPREQAAAEDVRAAGPDAIENPEARPQADLPLTLDGLPPALVETARLPLVSGSGAPMLAGASSDSLKTSY